MKSFGPIWSRHLFIRRALVAAFFVLALVPADAALAQSPTAELLAKPMALPEMALGSARAPVTVIAYFSLTCPHCAHFEENVLPLLRTKYIDSGKVRFVSREFPLDLKAVTAAMLVRCIADGDPKRYFDALAQIFILQPALLAQPLETLDRRPSLWDGRYCGRRLREGS